MPHPTGADKVVRCTPTATRGAVQPLQNSQHVKLDAVVRYDSVAEVEERGDVALHQRFIDATASRERVSTQKTLKREAGMEGAREQRGRGWPVYDIQQQIAAFKTERTRHKHAYKPTCKRSNIF